MDTERNSYLYFSIACVTLGIGYLVYFIGRPGAVIYAIPQALEQWIYLQPQLSEISGSLPGFFHTYTFVLLTFIVLGVYSRTSLYVSIALWVSLEGLIEIGQHPMVSESIISMIPAWFDQIPMLDIIDKYFLQGTFDPLDMFSILLASIAVLLTVRVVSGKEFYND